MPGNGTHTVPRLASPHIRPPSLVQCANGHSATQAQETSNAITQGWHRLTRHMNQASWRRGIPASRPTLRLPPSITLEVQFSLLPSCSDIAEPQKNEWDSIAPTRRNNYVFQSISEELPRRQNHVAVPSQMRGRHRHCAPYLQKHASVLYTTIFTRRVAVPTIQPHHKSVGHKEFSPHLGLSP